MGYRDSGPTYPGNSGQQWVPPGRRQPEWQPRQHDPAAHLRAATARRRAPYPRELTRFPWQLLPRGSRGRGHSLGYYVYLGRHWALTLIAMYIWALSASLVMCWALLVVTGWALWCAIVTIAWLAGAAAHALRGRL